MTAPVIEPAVAEPTAVALPLWEEQDDRPVRRRTVRRHRCARCRRTITGVISLRYRLGSGCRRILGITTRRRLRLSQPGRIRRAKLHPRQLRLLDLPVDHKIDNGLERVSA